MHNVAFSYANTYLSPLLGLFANANIALPHIRVL